MMQDAPAGVLSDEDLQAMLGLPLPQEQLLAPLQQQQQLLQQPGDAVPAASGAAAPLAGAMTAAQLERAASVHPVPERVPAALPGMSVC